MISRRNFLTLASGLLMPEPEPVRVYSFIWAPKECWRPALWKGLPVFRVKPEGDYPLVKWGAEPVELVDECIYTDRYRIGTLDEFERLRLDRRSRKETDGLYYATN